MSREHEAGCRCRVTLDELAVQVGSTDDHVRSQAQRIGYVVRGDWAGRDSLAVDDAAALVISMRGAVAGAQLAQEGQPR